MLCTLLIAALVAVPPNIAGASDEPDAIKVSETELQSSVMSFADRMSAILLTAFERYEKRNPAETNRTEVLSIVVYSLWNAYIIASESDPDIALLDMVSMVTLGRIVFEEQGEELFGKNIKPIVQGYRKAEEDIRGIAVLTLDHEQLEDLITLIRRWRKANPDVTYFPFIRFSTFSADRYESRLDREEAPDGLIDSVEAATRQAQEMRLLAERGLYLGTRMPQLASLFAELWAAKLADDVTTERRKAIAHLLEAFKAERKASIDDFMAHEEQIIENTLQQMTQTAEALVDRALRQVTILMALFLVGLTLANLLVGYVILRIVRGRQPPSS